MSLHLSFPLEQGLLHKLEVESVECILTPKFQLELVLPLDEDSTTEVEERPLPELSGERLATLVDAEGFESSEFQHLLPLQDCLQFHLSRGCVHPD